MKRRSFREALGVFECISAAHLAMRSRQECRPRGAAIESELNRIAEQTLKHETKLVRLARELGLNPLPTGTGVGFWQAVCYGRNYSLYINAKNNSFGCGYCRCKGGPEELRKEVRQRNETIRRRSTRVRR